MLRIIAFSIVAFFSTDSSLFAQFTNERQISLQNKNNSSSLRGIDWEDLFEDLFDEPDYFENKSYNLQFGIGFRSDITVTAQAKENDQLEIKSVIPAFSLVYEKNVWKNMGLGIGLGGRLWGVPVYNYQYRYFTGSLRATYHLNISDKFDPYIGLAGTFRYFDIVNDFSDREYNTKITATWLVGTKYYFSNRFGVFLEAGDDALSWFKGGISIYFP